MCERNREVNTVRLQQRTVQKRCNTNNDNRNERKKENFIIYDD